MGSISSQITSFTIVYSIVYSDADQRKHQSSASLAFVRVNSPHKWSVTRKMFPFDDVIMHHWSLGMDTQLPLTLYGGCNYVSVLRLELIHVSKRVPYRMACIGIASYVPLACLIAIQVALDWMHLLVRGTRHTMYSGVGPVGFLYRQQ